MPDVIPVGVAKVQLLPSFFGLAPPLKHSQERNLDCFSEPIGHAFAAGSADSVFSA
jgi:hypothetical protein